MDGLVFPGDRLLRLDETTLGNASLVEVQQMLLVRQHAPRTLVVARPPAAAVARREGKPAAPAGTEANAASSSPAKSWMRAARARFARARARRTCARTRKGGVARRLFRGKAPSASRGREFEVSEATAESPAEAREEGVDLALLVKQHFRTEDLVDVAAFLASLLSRSPRHSLLRRRKNPGTTRAREQTRKSASNGRRAQGRGARGGS